MKTEPVRRRSRWKRRLVFLALLFGITACFHGLALQSLARILVVEEPRVATQAVLMVGGESRYDAAAERHANGARTVFLLHSRPGRLERMGILPSTEQLTRREMIARGVPDDDLQFLSDEPVSNNNVGALICDWLRRHPDQEVDVLCDRFSTRKWRLLLRRSADPGLVSRIHLTALPHHRFDETNWWHSKPGARAILNSYLRLGFTWCNAGPQPDGRECAQADFESVLVPRATP